MQGKLANVPIICRHSYRVSRNRFEPISPLGLPGERHHAIATSSASYARKPVTP
jgi:hypothetical protein